MLSEGDVAHGTLSGAQVEQFVLDGWVKVEQAFSRPLADEGRQILWDATGCDPNDSSTWTHPVVRAGDRGEEPFRRAVNTPALHSAFDQLVGRGRWLPRQTLGSFAIRFPHPADPGDTGWHVDASFAPDQPTASFFDWRINVASQGRALLMLFLFSDVGEDDAPTRLRIGSHRRVAKLLEPAGAAGMSFMELARHLDATAGLEEAQATGSAGTVYLCHPFLAHAAQPHRGTAPRFMAQPPLYPAEPFDLNRPEADLSPVERAIRLGLSERI